MSLNADEYCISTDINFHCDICKECGIAAQGTYDIAASETLMRGRSRSSFRRELSSFSRRSFKSAIDCFLFLASPVERISYAAGMMLAGDGGLCSNPK